MTYGERLRELRAERRLSLREVEERGGPNKDTMSLIERGVHKPYPQTLGRIAQALDMNVSELRAELEAAEYPLAQAPLEPSFNDVLAEERRLDDDGALAILFRGLARRAQLIVERSRREGPSADLGEELTALHQEANALYRLRGRRDIRGRRSEELADAEGAYEEVESTIQAMLRQDVEATDEERDTARRFRPDAGDASKRRKADAS